MGSRPKNLSQAIGELEKVLDGLDIESKVEQELHRFTKTVEETVERLKPEVENLQTKMSDELKKAKEKVSQEVEKNPVLTLGLVGLFLLFLGYLLGRSRN